MQHLMKFLDTIKINQYCQVGSYNVLLLMSCVYADEA